MKKLLNVVTIHFRRDAVDKPAGFSLIELLVVMGLMASLLAFSGPAIQSLTGAGSVDRAISDVSDTLELARIYAMSHNTYVRVGIAQIGNEKILLMPIYAADGCLDQDSSSNMADTSLWPALGKSVLLNNFNLSQSLEASSPDTNNDDVPWNSASGIDTINRSIPGVSATPINCSACIQFQPSGEVRVLKNTSSRYIKVPIDQTGTRAGRNPFILRISGANGSIQILRKGEGI